MIATHSWSLVVLDLQEHKGCQGLLGPRVTKEMLVSLDHQGSSPWTCSTWELK